MTKKSHLKKENQAVEKTERLPVSEIESFFKMEERTDLQKYTITFALKKREK